MCIFGGKLPSCEMISDCGLSSAQEKEEGKEDSLEEDKDTEGSRGRKKKVRRHSWQLTSRLPTP